MTGQVRTIIARIADDKAEDAETKLDEIGDPAEWMKVYLALIEYAIPKLARIEKSINDASDEDLLAEVRRRKAEATEAEPKAKA